MRGASHFDLPEFERRRVQEAREQLRALVPSNLASRVAVRVRMGTVVEEITNHADRIQARLIVMGIRPKELAERFFFGSTSYGVLRKSRCPVWIVPGRKTFKSSRTEQESEALVSAQSRSKFCCQDKKASMQYTNVLRSCGPSKFVRRS